MVNLSALKLGTICPNCGSQKITKTKGKMENYCKSCGVVLEDLMSVYK